MDSLRTGLSYDDVLLIPQRSPVDSRNEIDLRTQLVGDIELQVPLVSAAMDTVTEADLARALAEAGGIGTIHRFLTGEQQRREVQAVRDAGLPVLAAVGVTDGYLERAELLVNAGVTGLVVDVAHGHLEKALEATGAIADEFPDVPLIAGNVATPAGVADLYAAGADGIKVGIGPGSHCTTRQVAGAGVPQFTAVADCASEARAYDITIMADGGIRRSGDAVKALMAGADSVMLGRLFAGTDEAPSEIVEIEGVAYKRSRGMATTAAARDRTDKDSDIHVEEGIEGLTPYKGPIASVVEEFTAGIRSGLSYCGGNTIESARSNAEFIQTTRREPDDQPRVDRDWESIATDTRRFARRNR